MQSRDREREREAREEDEGDEEKGRNGGNAVSEEGEDRWQGRREEPGK